MNPKQLLRRLRAQRGFTIVEMMVVVTILGFLATVSATLVTILFTANLKSSQLGSQQTTIENTFGFFSSRLALVQYGNIGTPETGSTTDTVNPLSLAGDQIMFTSTFASTSSAEKTCFRAAYLAELGEIRVASQPGSCDAATTIAPRRGPNAYLYGAKEPGTTTNQKQFYSPTDAKAADLFDPLIDSAYPNVQNFCNTNPSNTYCQKITELSPWTLASGIDSYDVPATTIGDINAGDAAQPPTGGASNNFAFPTVSSPYKNIVPAFAFTRRSGAAIPFTGNVGWVPPLVAGAPTGVANSVGGSGSSVGVRGDIGGVSVQALVAPVAREAGYNSEISSRFYEQRYSLQQLCSIFETSGEFSGGDLEGPYGSPQIRDGVIEYQDFGAGAFPSDREERGTSVALNAPAWSEIMRYNSSDISAAEEMPPGRYLVIASVTDSNVLDNNSATAVELALVHAFGTSSQVTIASTSSGTWPLTLSGVVSNLNPNADSVVVRARAKNNTTIPATSSLPVRLDLYWLGPVG